MDYREEKEAFEKHASKFFTTNEAFENDGKNYVYDEVKFMWDCWLAAKSQAVPEGRTDIQIIEQTIGIVRLIGESNSFECANSKVFPFESKSPRLQVWWRVACEIQELLTDTDPNNCDFEEYKAMVEAQEQSHEE